MFPLASARGRHGIAEAKRDELNQSGIIAVWQITALMPAKKTERPFLICQRTIPPILFGIQFAQVLAFGLRFHFWNFGLRPGELLSFLSRRVGDRRSTRYVFAINCRSTNGKIPPCW